MNQKLNKDAIIEAYSNGESMSSIAKRFGTYTTSVKRVLTRGHVEIRHSVNNQRKNLRKKWRKIN